MNANTFLKYINIDEHSSVPKYLQIANSIAEAIKQEQINANELLPSINELKSNFEISRDTVERSYRYLKKAGIIGSFPGKGFYARKTDPKLTGRIFLLFNKLSVHKKIIYDAFVSTMGEDTIIEFYIYNNDLSLFSNFLNNGQEYSHYVIIPHSQKEEISCELLDQIPKEKLLILDKKLKGIKGEYAEVVENFEKDIYTALIEALEPLRKYHTIKIIFPDSDCFPVEILDGFIRFCKNYGFNYNVV